MRTFPLRLTALLAAAFALAPAAWAQPATSTLLANIYDEPGSTAWSDAVEAIMVGRYDRNRSGTIDTRLELALVDCPVWQELERQHPDVLEIYGFAPDYIWVGYAFGFDEGLRSPAYQTAYTCLHPSGETVQVGTTYTPPPATSGTDEAALLLIGAVADPGSIEWKHAVGTILTAAYDGNRSGDLDTRAEVDAIGCRVWGAIQDGYASSGSYFWVGYGFPSHLIWNAESLGFDERMRGDGWAAIQRCFDTNTGRLRDGGGYGTAGTSATAARIASFDGADYSAWTDAVSGVIVPAYDRNGSGTLDTRAEIDALACADWHAMETSHNRNSGYSNFWVSAGFPSHLIWNAEGMGFAEGMRAYAWGAIQRCIPEAE